MEKLKEARNVKTIINAIIVELLVGIFFYGCIILTIQEHFVILKIIMYCTIIGFGIITANISDNFYKRKARKDKKKQKNKESKNFVKDNINVNEWTQVVPKEKTDDFLLNISDIADIYAYRQDESSAVEIYLDFHFEEKKRFFYERVKKRYFTEFYEIK